VLNDDSRLVVYSQDTPLWKSEEKYGMVPRYVQKPPTGVGAILSTTSDTDKSLRQTLSGRIMALDIGNDGKDEILLPKSSGGFLSSAKSSDLQGLRWNGARLDQMWSAKELPGPVLDIQLIRQANGAAQVLAMVRTKGGLFSKDRQEVMTFSLK
jgi:hypothetical protein